MIDRLPESGLPFNAEGQTVDPKALSAEHPITLLNAVFEENADLSFQDFPHPLNLLNCHFQGGLKLVDARLRSLDLSGSTFSGPVLAEAVEISSNLRARETTFEDHFDLTDAEIRGGVLLTGATLASFTGHRMEVGGQLRLDTDWERPSRRFTAKGGVRMVAASIGATLRCDGGLFEDALDIESSQIGLSFLTRAGTGEHNQRIPFEIHGHLRAMGARIGEGWDCDGSLFYGDVNAETIKIGRSFVMRAGIWDVNGGMRAIAKGEIRLYMAEVGGSFELDGAQILGGIDATRIRVADDMYIRRGMMPLNAEFDFECGGAIDLTYAEVGGALDFRGAKTHEVTAPGIVIRGDVLLDEETSCAGAIHLEQAQIDGSLKCDKASLRELALKNARVSDEFRYRAGLGAPEIDLRHAAMGVLNLVPPAEEKAAANFRLLGLTYRDLADGSVAADESTLAFLKASDGGEFYPQPYRHLFKNLRALGHAREAVRVIIAMKDQEYERFCRNRVGLRSWIEWPFRWLHKTLTGYGYQPGRALSLALVLAATAICVYAAVQAQGWGYWMGYYGPVLKSSETMGQQVEFLAPVYALDVLIPVLDFGQAGAYQPRIPYERGATDQAMGWALVGFNWFLTSMGWVLSTLLLASVGGVMRRIDSDE